MRRANRGRELQIFADGQVLIESVFLRDVTDVALELIEIRIKGLIIKEDLATVGLQLSGQDFEQRAFPRAARPHHANQFPARDIEGNSFQPDIAAANADRKSTRLKSSHRCISY